MQVMSPGLCAPRGQEARKRFATANTGRNFCANTRRSFTFRRVEAHFALSRLLRGDFQQQVVYEFGLELRSLICGYLDCS